MFKAVQGTKSAKPGLQEEVKSGKFRGKEYLFLRLPGVNLCHQEVPILDLPIKANTHHLGVEKLEHLHPLHTQTDLVGDMVLVRSMREVGINWAYNMGESYDSRFCVFPELHHMVKNLGRKRVSDIMGHLTFGDVRINRVYSTRPHVASLGSFAQSSSGMTVCPFMTLDSESTGERDGVFFYPVHDALMDPNWLICYVQNVRMSGRCR